VVLLIVAVKGQERVRLEVAQLAHAVHDQRLGGEAAGLEFHRHHRVALVRRHLDEDVVEVERVFDGHEVHAELGQLAEAELAVARLVPEVAGHVVMQVKRGLGRVVEDGREIIDGIQLHHQPHINHEADDAGVGFRVHQPRADDGGLVGVVAEDARAGRILAAVAGGGMLVGAGLRFPSETGGQGQGGGLAEEATLRQEGAAEMGDPDRIVGRAEVGKDFLSVTLLVHDEFLDQLARGPVGEVVRGLQVVPVGGEQGGLEHPVEAGEGHVGVGRHHGLVEEPAQGGADVFTGAEAAELAAAFAEEPGVAGGFPHVLAEQVFQLRLADAVDERRGSADELALGLEDQMARQIG